MTDVQRSYNPTVAASCWLNAPGLMCCDWSIQPSFNLTGFAERNFLYRVSGSHVWRWRCLCVSEMFGSCLVIAVIAALYEGLKMVRERLLQKAWSISCNGDAVAVPTTDIQTAETVKLPNRCVRQVTFFLRTCGIFMFALFLNNSVSYGSVSDVSCGHFD